MGFSNSMFAMGRVLSWSLGDLCESTPGTERMKCIYVAADAEGEL